MAKKDATEEQPQPVVNEPPALTPTDNTPSTATAEAPADATQPLPQPESQTAVQVEDGFTNRPSSPVTMTPGAGPANEPPMQNGASVISNDPTQDQADPDRVEATSAPHMLRVTEAQYNDTVRVAEESGAQVESGIAEQDGRRIGKLIVDGEDRSYEIYG